MSEGHLKIVIGLRGDKGSVALQAEGCDPLFFPLEEGTLEAVLARVPGLVEEARQRWVERPTHLKYDRPTLPSPPPRPISIPTPPRPPARPSPQPTMF